MQLDHVSNIQIIMKINKSNKGFTLIELLVVIAIIGILASVVLLSLNVARGKAGDVKVISGVKQLRQIVESNSDGVSYPDLSNDSYIFGGLTADGNPGSTTINLVLADILTQNSDINVVNAPSDPGSFVTSYAIYGRLISSSTQYMCVDSTGQTNLQALTNNTAACPQ